MFHKTVLRLTGLYLIIIMSISVLFSATLFTLSARELDRGFRRQGAFISEFPSDGTLIPPSLQRQFLQNRDEVSVEAKAHMFTNLVLANLGIFVLAGGLSYILAKRSLEPIEEAHRSLEQFTADASHELRTPIAAMKSEIEVALMQSKISDKDSRELLTSNLEEIDSLTKLTSDLLSLARLEELKLDLGPLQLKPTISSVIKKLSPVAEKKNMSIQVSYTEKDTKARADKRALSEALIILIDNAIKYGDKDSTVSVAIVRARDRVRISVTNQGVGIRPDAIKHVFDRFYRSDSSRSNTTTGHGLGLAIAKQLIERQRGCISIDSVPGAATVATITLQADSTN